MKYKIIISWVWRTQQRQFFFWLIDRIAHSQLQCLNYWFNYNYLIYIYKILLNKSQGGPQVNVRPPLNLANIDGNGLTPLVNLKHKFNFQIFTCRKKNIEKILLFKWIWLNYKYLLEEIIMFKSYRIIIDNKNFLLIFN